MAFFEVDIFTAPLQAFSEEQGFTGYGVNNFVEIIL
jgi:hypothetical protein